MQFARWSFALAAAWGVFMLLPLYFQEDWYVIVFPPALTHPEFFYAFITTGLTMQFIFILIAMEPLRLRPVMLAGIAVKIGFPTTYLVLYYGGRLDLVSLKYALPDFVFAALFLLSYLRLRSSDTLFRG